MDFSVIIPAYNVSGIIGRAIRSAAAQTAPPLEILVIDDCSTDDTVEVVRALGPEIPSLRLLSTPVNGGPSAARNVGLREAKADWIALLNSDDAWKPGRLKRLSEVASATSADFISNNLVMWDAVAEAQFKPAYYELPGVQKQITLLDLFRADDNFNFTKASFSLMKPIFRKFLADRKLEYNESLKVGEDFVLFAESLFNDAKVILIKEAYYIYSMPSGPSGRGPHSRTVYEVSKLPQESERLSQKYRDRVDATLRRAWMITGRPFKTLLHQSDVARTYRWSGQYAQYFAYLAARPELTRRLFSRAAMKIGKRLQQVAGR